MPRLERQTATDSTPLSNFVKRLPSNGSGPACVRRLHRARAGGGASSRSTETSAGCRCSGALLPACDLIGDPLGAVAVLGIEPAEVATGIGLSPPVQTALPNALE